MIVGLGNPGLEYVRTRHNAGFLALDCLMRRHAAGAVPRGRFHALTVDVTIGAEKCILVKPTTYMNRSGQAVAEAVRFYKLDPVDDLLVLVDDVALPVGSVRVRQQGSAGGHNGLFDIERLLGTDEYARCRIGIDGPGRIPQKDYVLGRFTDEQREAVEGAIEKSADAAEVWVERGVTSAMNTFNVRPPKPKQEEKPTETAQPEINKIEKSDSKTKDNDHSVCENDAEQRKGDELL